MKNQDIRKAILDKNLFQYQVAKAIGINEGTLTRWLRDDLPEDKKKMVLDAIKSFK